jgi:rhodanese-related sulfurtransferase
MLAAALRALLLVVAGAALGLGVNGLRKNGLRVGSFEEPAVCDHAEAAGAPLEIDPTEVAGLCGRPDVVIADARPANRFAEGHVAGAIHLPCDAEGAVASDALHHLDDKQTLIVYGETTDDAQPVAASLRRRIHKPSVRVAVLRGGFQAWSAAGQACASGPCAECKEQSLR